MRLSSRSPALAGRCPRRVSVVAFSVLAAPGVVAALPARPAQAADLSAVSTTLSSVFAAAQPGDTIRLAPGDYGTFRGGVKAGPVTITGAGASLEVDLSGAQNVRFDGITVAGATVAASRNITFANSTFTDMSVVRVGTPGAGIVFDHDTFADISPCGSCYEGRITVVGTGQHAAAAGVTISNSRFSGGSADGIQLVGEASGVQIGPGNEFTGLQQNSAVHTDPIQLYGADDTVITGNYVHDSSTGIMAPDGTDGAMTITNNVFAKITQPAMYLGHKPGVRIEHNTVAGGIIINDDPAKSGPKTSGVTIKNNVVTSGLTLQNLAGGAIAQEDYNLMPGGGGAHDLRGAPQFVGGGSPGSMAGFALAPGSPGVKAADDGTDMGAFGGPGAVGAPPAAASPPVAAPPVVAKPAAAGAPTLTLQRPTPGARHSRSLRFLAKAADDHGIRRVEFWVDGRKVATDRRARYSRTWRGWARLGRGPHTASARAVSRDGGITTRSVVVVRARKRPHSTRARAAWSVQSTPGAGTTVLTGTGVPGQQVAVRLARCGRRTATTAVRQVLTAQASGELAATVATPGLCIAKLAAL